MTLEAFAWGLLGSSLTQRVLTGAAIAAVGFTPVWLLAIVAPGPIIFPFRVMLAIGLTVVSLATFLNQSRETSLGAPSTPEPEAPVDPRQHFLEVWDRYEREDEIIEATLVEDAPASLPERGWGYPAIDDEPADDRRKLRGLTRIERKETRTGRIAAGSPVVADRSTGPANTVGAHSGRFVVGPHADSDECPGAVAACVALARSGLRCRGVCSRAARSVLSIPRRAAFSLERIWRFKTGFWLVAAIAVASIMSLGTLLLAGVLAAFRGPRGDYLVFGTFAELMGPFVFAGVWLIYGFCVGQVFVLLCRKTILALLVSVLMSLTAIGMWLPSLLCGGMSGWQVWAPPLVMLAATWCLMRAWTGGRIWERKPIAALVGFGAGIGVWALMNFGYRAWEAPNVGAPIDVVAYRESVPAAKDNATGKVIQKTIGLFDEAVIQRGKVAELEELRIQLVPPGRWGFQQQAQLTREKAKLDDLESRYVKAIAEATGLPAGVIELPRGDGQSAQLKHLPKCRDIALELRSRARTAERGQAFEYLAQILALSRNLRNKAPLESYLAGIDIEDKALEGLDHWLDRGKPDPKLLRRVLDELNRHAEETPPPLDCVQTECFRSVGLVGNPNAWSFAGRGAGVREQWVAGSIALSMETPWENERKTRLWQLVWAGLFRGIETPHWERPKETHEPLAEKNATRSVLKGWLPATEGPGAGVTRDRMIRLLDASWLADERLFCSISQLREKSTRARWRVDSMRLALAVAALSA